MMLLGLIGAAAGIAIGWAVRLAHSGIVDPIQPRCDIDPCERRDFDYQTVMNMVKAGLGDELILEKLKYSRCAFLLSSADLTQLKEGGISDRVITRMLHTQDRIGPLL